MATLRVQLAEVEAQATALRRRIAASTCAEAGHDWVSLGGANAGCDLGDDCACSVPVHECRHCEDCDYGDNAEADDIRAECRLTRTDSPAKGADVATRQNRESD